MGNIRSGTVPETTLNYTGQRRDGTGLLYYGARYYDPAIGRFLSPDSIVPNAANPQGLNRYAYVGNNPLRYTDPTGHCGGEGEDCGALPDYEPSGERGDGGRSGGDGGGDGGHDTGGQAALAALVALIDQITVGGADPNVSVYSSPAPGSSLGGAVITPGGPSVIPGSTGDTIPDGFGLPGSTGGSTSGGFMFPGSTGGTIPDGFALPGSSADPFNNGFQLGGVLGSSEQTVDVVLPNGDVVHLEPDQIDKKYAPHAPAFGVDGNNNRVNRDRFRDAIAQHILDPDTQQIVGTYKNDPVTHYVNANTAIDVYVNPSSNFVSGYKLNPVQLSNVLSRGSL